MGKNRPKRDVGENQERLGYTIPAESLAGDGSPLFYTPKTMFMYCVIWGGSGGAGPS